jgi:hypothetical protein
MRRLIDRLVHRRQYELWVAAGVGRPFFMAACALTRREACAAACHHTASQPGARTMVLDGQGAPVHW